MLRAALVLTLLSLPLLLVPTAPADHGESCQGDPRFVPVGDAYVLAASVRGGSNEARVLGIGAKDSIVFWQGGVHNEAYLESNGLPGLQAGAHCTHPDTLLARTYTGVVGPKIPL